MGGARLFLLLAVFFAVASPAAQRKRLAAVDYGVAQMSRGPTNYLILHAEVNGKASAFLIDTGSDLSFLRADRASLLGLRALDKTVRTAGRAFPAGTVANLQIGQRHFQNIEFAVLPASEVGQVRRNTTPAEADGILGLDFLRRYVAVINCHTLQIFFKTDATPHLNLTRTTKAMGFTRVPIIPYQRDFLTVPSHLNGRLGRMILDTAAFVTVLSDGVVREFRITEEPSRLTSRGLDGRVREIELAEVKDLRIGNVAIAPQRFAVIDLFDSRKPARTHATLSGLQLDPERRLDSGEPIFGLLGDELLDQRQGIIDLESMSLFLK